MKAEQRRKRIIELLTASEGPLAGDKISDLVKVSRQIVVQDVSILRTQGYDIVPTHRGYVLINTPLAEREFYIKHSKEDIPEELTTIVQLGGSVIDVFVVHDVYGKIQVKLNLFSLKDIDEYLRRMNEDKSLGLMRVTGGYHYHTIRAESKEVLDKIEQALKAKGFLIEE